MKPDIVNTMEILLYFTQMSKIFWVSVSDIFISSVRVSMRSNGKCEIEIRSLYGCLDWVSGCNGLEDVHFVISVIVLSVCLSEHLFIINMIKIIIRNTLSWEHRYMQNLNTKSHKKSTLKPKVVILTHMSTLFSFIYLEWLRGHNFP